MFGVSSVSAVSSGSGNSGNATNSGFIGSPVPSPTATSSTLPPIVPHGLTKQDSVKRRQRTTNNSASTKEAIATRASASAASAASASAGTAAAPAAPIPSSNSTSWVDQVICSHSFDSHDSSFPYEVIEEKPTFQRFLAEHFRALTHVDLLKIGFWTPIKAALQQLKQQSKKDGSANAALSSLNIPTPLVKPQQSEKSSGAAVSTLNRTSSTSAALSSASASATSSSNAPSSSSGRRSSTSSSASLSPQPLDSNSVSPSPPAAAHAATASKLQALFTAPSPLIFTPKNDPSFLIPPLGVRVSPIGSESRSASRAGNDSAAPMDTTTDENASLSTTLPPQSSLGNLVTACSELGNVHLPSIHEEPALLLQIGAIPRRVHMEDLQSTVNEASAASSTAAATSSSSSSSLSPSVVSPSSSSSISSSTTAISNRAKSTSVLVMFSNNFTGRKPSRPGTPATPRTHSNTNSAPSTPLPASHQQFGHSFSASTTASANVVPGPSLDPAIPENVDDTASNMLCEYYLTTMPASTPSSTVASSFSAPPITSSPASTSTFSFSLSSLYPTHPFPSSQSFQSVWPEIESMVSTRETIAESNRQKQLREAEDKKKREELLEAQRQWEAEMSVHSHRRGHAAAALQASLQSPLALASNAAAAAAAASQAANSSSGDNPAAAAVGDAMQVDDAAPGNAITTVKLEPVDSAMIDISTSDLIRSTSLSPSPSPLVLSRQSTPAIIHPDQLLLELIATQVQLSHQLQQNQQLRKNIVKSIKSTDLMSYRQKQDETEKYVIGSYQRVARWQCIRLSMKKGTGDATLPPALLSFHRHKYHYDMDIEGIEVVNGMEQLIDPSGYGVPMLQPKTGVELEHDLTRESEQQNDFSVCCVCFGTGPSLSSLSEEDQSVENSNPLVFCEICNVCVHLYCYGIASVPEENEWICQWCQAHPEQAKKPKRSLAILTAPAASSSINPSATTPPATSPPASSPPGLPTIPENPSPSPSTLMPSVSPPAVAVQQLLSPVNPFLSPTALLSPFGFPLPPSAISPLPLPDAVTTTPSTKSSKSEKRNADKSDSSTSVKKEKKESKDKEKDKDKEKEKEKDKSKDETKDTKKEKEKESASTTPEPLSPTAISLKQQAKKLAQLEKAKKRQREKELAAEAERARIEADRARESAKRAERKRRDQEDPYPCCLCSVRGGALKPCDEFDVDIAEYLQFQNRRSEALGLPVKKETDPPSRLWAHIVCALWLPRTTVDDVSSMQYIKGSKAAWKFRSFKHGLPIPGTLPANKDGATAGTSGSTAASSSSTKSTSTTTGSSSSTSTGFVKNAFALNSLSNLHMLQNMNPLNLLSNLNSTGPEAASGSTTSASQNSSSASQSSSSSSSSSSLSNTNAFFPGMPIPGMAFNPLNPANLNQLQALNAMAQMNSMFGLSNKMSPMDLSLMMNSPFAGFVPPFFAPGGTMKPFDFSTLFSSVPVVPALTATAAASSSTSNSSSSSTTSSSSGSSSSSSKAVASSSSKPGATAVGTSSATSSSSTSVGSSSSGTSASAMSSSVAASSAATAAASQPTISSPAMTIKKETSGAIPAVPIATIPTVATPVLRSLAGPPTSAHLPFLNATPVLHSFGNSLAPTPGTNFNSSPFLLPLPPLPISAPSLNPINSVNGGTGMSGINAAQAINTMNLMMGMNSGSSNNASKVGSNSPAAAVSAAKGPSKSSLVPFSTNAPAASASTSSSTALSNLQSGVCGLCKKAYGCCVYCSADMCSQSFHPLCAWYAGLYMRIDTGNLSTDIRYFMYCYMHTPLRVLGIQLIEDESDSKSSDVKVEVVSSSDEPQEKKRKKVHFDSSTSPPAAAASTTETSPVPPATNPNDKADKGETCYFPVVTLKLNANSPSSVSAFVNLFSARNKLRLLQQREWRNRGRQETTKRAKLARRKRRLRLYGAELPSHRRSTRTNADGTPILDRSTRGENKAHPKEDQYELGRCAVCFQTDEELRSERNWQQQKAWREYKSAAAEAVAKGYAPPSPPVFNIPLTTVPKSTTPNGTKKKESSTSVPPHVIAFHNSNPMLRCSDCEMEVHVKCYGIQYEEVATQLQAAERRKMKLERVVKLGPGAGISTQGVNTSSSSASSSSSSATLSTPFSASAMQQELDELHAQWEDEIWEDWEESEAEASSSSQQWKCRRCNDKGEKDIACALCFRKGGAFKKTDDGSWVHVVCAQWIPEVTFADEYTLEPVTGLDEISPARRRLKCYLCRRSGPCIECSEHTCNHAFHPLCGMLSGQLMIEIHDSILNLPGMGSSNSCTFLASCRKHTPLHLARFVHIPQDYTDLVWAKKRLDNSRTIVEALRVRDADFLSDTGIETDKLQQLWDKEKEKARTAPPPVVASTAVATASSSTASSTAAGSSSSHKHSSETAPKKKKDKSVSADAAGSLLASNMPLPLPLINPWSGTPFMNLETFFPGMSAAFGAQFANAQLMSLMFPNMMSPAINAVGGASTNAANTAAAAAASAAAFNAMGFNMLLPSPIAPIVPAKATASTSKPPSSSTNAPSSATTTSASSSGTSSSTTSAPATSSNTSSSSSSTIAGATTSAATSSSSSSATSSAAMNSTTSSASSSASSSSSSSSTSSSSSPLLTSKSSQQPNGPTSSRKRRSEDTQLVDEAKSKTAADATSTQPPAKRIRETATPSGNPASASGSATPAANSPAPAPSSNAKSRTKRK